MLFILLLTFSVCVASLPSGYHSTETIFEEIRTLASLHPQLTYHMHDDIMVVDWNAGSDHLWVMNEHAREVITAEVALSVIKELVVTNPSVGVTIVPILNVWGRKRVENGDTCLRKNENGVDTNRNFQITKKHHYRRHSEEYEGTHAISEKESKLVSSLLKNSVKRYINIHSGEFSLYMPFDSTTERPPNYETLKRFINRLSPLCKQCTVGSAAEKSFYKAFGTSVDYATHLGVEAYTFEIYGKEDSDCMAMFNPENPTEITKMWTKILMYTLL